MPSRLKKLKIGITGGVGSGKTLAAKYFESLGYKVIYADKVAKELYKKNPQLKKKLVKEFGKEILDDSGNIDLNGLRRLVLSGKNTIKRVNKIVHPFVFREIEKAFHSAKGNIVFIEAAIMFETGSSKKMDYVILIYANKQNRIKRITKRDGVSTSDVKKIMDIQMDERKKLKLADFTVNNNYTPADLKKNIHSLEKILRKLI
jgi:dephospho-CoA kinase